MIIGSSNTMVIPKTYRGLQVLLVVNDTTFSNNVKSTLEQYSYKVSPGVAVSMVGDDGYYDLIITDMDLMESDDLRFFNHIILNTELPIILMSWDENNVVLRKALNEAACSFVRKPIRPQVLASVWQHVFRVRRMQNIWEQGNTSIEPNDQESSHVQIKVHPTHSQNLSNDNSRLVINQELILRKTEANRKPRLSWTDELRLKFEKAVTTLGEEKARPKEILKLMGVSNVTLRHISSHLQKYRDKIRPSRTSGIKRHYQNGKPSPVAGQYVPQQYNTQTSSVHYQIDMVKKLLDKAKSKKSSGHYDDTEGSMSGGCKEPTVKRSSMHGSNPIEGEANTFRHKEYSENISAVVLNPYTVADSGPYAPDIYQDYLASNDCSSIFNYLNTDMDFILSEPNGSGRLEDIILSSQRLEN